MLNIPSHNESAFNANFSQPYAPVAGTEPPVEPPSSATAPRVSYSAQIHGSHADFQRSEDFVQYKNQVGENLSFIAAFCQEHEMPDAQDIKMNFDVFFRNRFDRHHYFDTSAEVVDSIGKQSLDEFCAMICDEAIYVETRKAAIRNLSEGMTSDPDSVVSDLISAAGVLAKAAGGLRGKLWKLKEDIATKIVAAAVHEQYHLVRDYDKEEDHYISTAWNLLANQFGLQKIPQGNEMRCVTQNSAFMRKCEQKVAAALTSDRSYSLIAKTCQARFNSQISTDPEKSSKIWDADTADKARQTLKKIGEDLGLVTEDQHLFDSEKKDWVFRESDLRLKSFVKFEEDDSPAPGIYAPPYTPTSPEYTLRTDSSLIALDILRTMIDMKLLGPNNYPHMRKEWIDENGRRAAIFTYGDQECVARTDRRVIFQNPVWDTPEVEFELITLADLSARDLFERDV